MCRVIALVLIAAVLPAVILAEENITTPIPKIICSLNTSELIDMRINLAHCWGDVINIFAGQPVNFNICHNITDLEDKLELLFTKSNETCPAKREQRSSTFLDMLNKTSQNIDVFRTFYNQRCEGLQTYIDSCLNTGIYAKDGAKPGKMGWYQKFHLNYDLLPCDLEKGIKSCTIKKLQENCPNTVEYATLMFDESLKNCAAPVPAENKPSSAKITTPSTITVLATVPLILVQYYLSANIN